MRVTQRQLHQLALSSLTSSRTRLSDAQRVATSGLRVDKPSDDPAAAARARILNSNMNQAEAHRGNASSGLSRLQTAEEALAHGGNVLIRAKEIALAMANGAMSASERSMAAIEVQQLRSAMIDAVNSKFGNEYVFAHIDVNSPPMDAAGNFTYNPDVCDEVRRVEVGPWQLGEIGASGSHAFALRVADPSSIDVVGLLAQIETDLATNDVVNLRVGIDGLDQAFSQVVAERARTGMRIQRVRDADTAAQQNITLYTELRSDLVEADAAEAFSRLSLAETTVAAAVAVAGRVLGPSLLDEL